MRQTTAAGRMRRLAAQWRCAYLKLKNITNIDEPDRDETRRLKSDPEVADISPHLRIPKLLTAAEVAEALGLSKARVYCLIREKRLPSVKCGRSVRISDQALIAWIEAGGAGLD